MLLTIIAGARPNFMKIAPIIRAVRSRQDQGVPIRFRLVHTGQHYDKSMSGNFFEQLGIPDPDVNLECGGGSQAEQTAAIMVKFEKELQENRPDVVLVVGDVTSTMACTITAKKLMVDVVHVEAGIRSGDMTMPEEINRIVTDSLCDHFFTTSEWASRHLLNTGSPAARVHFVGNTMIDTLLQNQSKFSCPDFFASSGLKEGEYLLLTLHRPSNVDDADKLLSMLEAISGIAGDRAVVFPVHPRTRQVLERVGYRSERLLMIEPQPYHQFMYLVKHALGVVTDSGGITEEATVLNIPCLTLRNSTERPETVEIGTNELIGDDLDKLKARLHEVVQKRWKKGGIPPLWDGKTSDRIVDILVRQYLK